MKIKSDFPYIFIKLFLFGFHTEIYLVRKYSFLFGLAGTDWHIIQGSVKRTVATFKAPKEATVAGWREASQ